MKLSSTEALKILNDCRGKAPDDNWIDHSITVGKCAEKIAKAFNLDGDYAKVLGYVHDIGKRFGWNKSDGVLVHAYNGYKFMKSIGADEDIAGICLKHSFLNNDINCLANDRDFTDKKDLEYDFIKEYIKQEYTIYEKIINLCDLMCTSEVMTVDKRLIDLLRRHGIFKNTQYHLIETFKLKDFFDDLLGFNVYDLFPEIKDNL